MGIKHPKATQCGAAISDGTFCGKPKEIGSERCGAHGGLSLHAAPKPKLSLYSQRLRATFTAEDQLLWDEMPKGVDLTEELRVARIRVLRYQSLLNETPPKEWIYTEGKSEGAQGGYSEGALSVHDLLEKALDTVRRLAQSQNEIAPGSNLGGNLRITFEVAGRDNTVDGELIPELTDNSPVKMPVEDDLKAPVIPSTSRGYDDES